jgi:hypothetical protein
VPSDNVDVPTTSPRLLMLPAILLVLVCARPGSRCGVPSLPQEHSMRPRHEHRRQSRIRAQTRGADRLAVVVDPEGESDGVAVKWTEFPDLAVWLPYRGFEAETLIRRCAFCFLISLLRKHDYLVSIVDPNTPGSCCCPGWKAPSRRRPSKSLRAIAGDCQNRKSPHLLDLL